MALRGPHKRMKIAGCRVGFSIVWWVYPSPPLDSGFRRSDESGVYFHSNRSCRLPPAHQGMKSRSCGLVQLIGAADSATPHPDPSGGQAPALHFLIPPSAIGIQFGTFRRWRAGIEVDWRAHFRTKDECRGSLAHSNAV